MTRILDVEGVAMGCYEQECVAAPDERCGLS
jgi:hypothetical protein